MAELVLAVKSLDICRVFSRKVAKGQKLNEFESQLYEASARYAATILNFHDTVSQSALIRAERELDDLHTQGKAC